MKKLKKFLSEMVPIPMWSILLFDFVAVMIIVLNLIIIAKQ